MTKALVFPGQGSQSVGMLQNLAANFPIVEKTFSEASEVLGYDLWSLVQNGPEIDLNATDRTQPAMLAAGIACWRVWQASDGDVPTLLAGHSLGEYSALVAADALSFADAIAVVADRGRFMQEAVPAGTGAMAAVLGLDDAQVLAVCETAAQGDVLEAVNFNSPGQVVIAGSAEAVSRAVDVAKEAGAKRAIILPVSVPSHCALMKPAAERLADRLASIVISSPQIPVIHNADVQAYSSPDQIRDALVRQLFSPVRWVETVQYFTAQSIDTVIECGPGKVLAGLNKRIERKMPVFPVFDEASLSTAIQA